MSFPLSVLDLVPISSGSTAAQAMRNSIDLARVVDRLGYTRYWFAEHHNMASVASSVPEVMIGQAVRETTKLRVGSGGVMLPNHPPLKIAETFRMLEALYPGRIDLGIGRAPGTDPLTAYALRRNKDGGHAHEFPGFPPLWLLGSSASGAQLAASLGLGFAFAHHINPQNALDALRTYQQEFVPSTHLAEPYAILAVAAIVAETPERAEELASSVALAIVRMRNGQPMPFPSPEEALAYPYTPAERAQVEAYRRSTQIVGDAQSVRTQLDRLVDLTGANELMIASLIHSHEARVRSYELLAEAYGLRDGVTPTS